MTIELYTPAYLAEIDKKYFTTNDSSRCIHCSIIQIKFFLSYQFLYTHHSHFIQFLASSSNRNGTLSTLFFNFSMSSILTASPLAVDSVRKNHTDNFSCLVPFPWSPRTLQALLINGSQRRPLRIVVLNLRNYCTYLHISHS